MSAIGYITMGNQNQEDVDEVRRWPTTLLFLSLLFGVSTLVAAFLRWTDYTSPYAATPPLTSPEWLTPERVIALLALLTALFALILLPKTSKGDQNGESSCTLPLQYFKTSHQHYLKDSH